MPVKLTVKFYENKGGVNLYIPQVVLAASNLKLNEEAYIDTDMNGNIILSKKEAD